MSKHLGLVLPWWWLGLPADLRERAPVRGGEIIRIVVVAMINTVSDLRSWQKVLRPKFQTLYIDSMVYVAVPRRSPNYRACLKNQSLTVIVVLVFSAREIGCSMLHIRLAWTGGPYLNHIYTGIHQSITTLGKHTLFIFWTYKSFCFNWERLCLRGE